LNHFPFLSRLERLERHRLTGLRSKVNGGRLLYGFDRNKSDDLFGHFDILSRIVN
jgi:hypothetical protein